MTTQMQTIQATLCHGVKVNDNWIARCNMLIPAGTTLCDFGWSKMGNYFIAPKQVIVVPRFKGFIWISYDYNRGYDYGTVRVSERITTSHFRELYSLN